MTRSEPNHTKNAVVVGATGNLGRAVCAELTRLGYRIDPTWNKPDHPDATKAESYWNLSDTLDVAIYLAGMNVIEKTERLTEEQWDKVFNVNLKGAFLFAKAAFPAMKLAGRATFVVISSIMVTHPYPGRTAYTASKAGLEGFTRSLAVEWGPYGIATHCIQLGHLEGLMKTTPANPQLLQEVRAKTPSGKLIQPREVASYIGWLVEGGSQATSGNVMTFDPAYTINRWPL